MRHVIRIAATLCILQLLIFLPSSSGTQTESNSKNHGKVVYVCACLGNRSCSCMTMAKTGGPCACGTTGGPPLKAIPSDSDWAKENLKALAK